MIQLIGQFGVIRSPIRLDPLTRLAQGYFAAVNRAPIGHNARDHPQPRCDARTVSDSPHTIDQGWIQLIRTAIQIDEGARRGGLQ